MKKNLAAIESCSSRLLRGFICFQERSTPPELRVHVDGKSVGVATLTVPRKLHGNIKSVSCFSFEFSFSPLLTGNKLIKVVLDTGEDIANSPWIYCCDSISSLQSSQDEIRIALSHAFIHGTGIEIGALHNPQPVNSGVNVKYLDKFTVSELRTRYPELKDKMLVEADIVDDGETLSTVQDSSQNFIVASHFIEHAKNPIGFLMACARVLTPGGVLLLAVPDKRYTFDVDRPLTTIEHIVDDYMIGHESQKHIHFEEIASCKKGLTKEDVEERIRKMATSDYSYHWHVWTPTSFLEFISCVLTKFSINLELSLFFNGKGEFFVVLTKT